MADIVEYLKKKRENTSNNNGGESITDYLKRKRGEEKAQEEKLASNFSSWANDVNTYFSNWDDERQKRNSSYQTAADIDAYRNESAVWQSKYAQEANRYIDYVNKNKENIQNADKTLEWLQNVKTGLDTQSKYLQSDRDFWNQFENEDQYNAYAAYNKWNNVDQNEDFEEKSKYVPYEKKDNSSGEVKKALSHQWINEGAAGMPNMQVAAKAAEANHYDEFDKILTDDLRKKYNYIYATEGYDAAKQYLYGVLQNSDVKYEWYEILPDAIKEGIGANSFDILRNKITGDVSDYEMENRNVLRQKEFAQDETLSKIGKTAGSVILTVALSGISGGIGGAVSGASSAALSTTLGEGAKLFGTASAKIAENAIKAGLTSAFIQGSRYAIQNAGNAALSGNWKDYVIDTGVSAGIGAAAGSTSALVSDIGMNALAGKVVGGNEQLIPKGSIKEMQNILNKHSLINNKWAVAAIGGASGLTYSAIHSGLNEAYNASKNKDYKFNVSDFATEAAIGMLYGFFLNLTKSYTQSPNETVNEYKKEVKYKYFDENMTPEEAAKAHRELAREYSPDNYPNADAAQKQNLNDELSKINAEYDVWKENHAAETASSSFNAMKAAAAAGDPVAYQNAAEEFNSAVEVVKNAAQETGSSDIAEIAEALEAISADISSPESFPKTEDIGVLSSMGNNPQYAPAMQEQTESLPFKYKEDPKLSPIWDTILKNAEEGLQRANNVPAAVKPVEKGDRFLKSREVGEVGMAVYDSLINPADKNPIIYQDYVEKVPVDFYGAYFYPDNKEKTVLQDWEKEAIHLAAEIDKGDVTEQKLKLLSDLLATKGEIKKEEQTAAPVKANYEQIVKDLPEEVRDDTDMAVDLAKTYGGTAADTFKNILANRIREKGDISTDNLAALLTAFGNYYNAGKENMELTDVKEANENIPVNDLLTTKEKEAAWLAGNRDVDTENNRQYNGTERGVENGSGDLRVHNSGKRNDSANSGKGLSGVAEKAGASEKGRLDVGREGSAASFYQKYSGRLVSPVEMGIDGGSRKKTLELVNEDFSEETKAVAKQARKDGMEAVFFTGKMLASNDKAINAVLVKHKTAIIGVDNKDFSVNQLFRHEKVHKVVFDENEKRYEETLWSLWDILTYGVDPDTLNDVLEDYAIAYGQTLDTDAEKLYVIEEIIADVYADMNSYHWSKAKTARYQEIIKNQKNIEEAIDNLNRAKRRAEIKGETKLSLGAVDNVFNEIYETLPDGRIKPKNVNDLSTEDWKLIYKAVNKLGYGLKSANDAKEVYSRYVGKNGFNAEQSEAIKKAYGVVDATGISANPAREALAKKTFGTTGNFKEAGYLLRNGSMLDFSGKKQGGPANARTMDHREIASIFKDDEIPEDKRQYGDSTAYMNAFISEGNIRLMDGQGVTIGEMEPTAQQYTVLKQFIDHVLDDEEYFYLDLSNNAGITIDSRDYYPADGSKKIISDIKYYFKNGELPYQSSLSQFRYSKELDKEYMEAVEDEDMEKAADLVGVAAAAAGYTKEGYHGTRKFGFTVIDTEKSDDKISFFVTDQLETASTYSGMRDVTEIGDDAGEAGANDEMEEVYLAIGVLEEAMENAVPNYLDHEQFSEEIEDILNGDGAYPEEEVEDMVNIEIEQMFSYSPKNKQYDGFYDWLQDSEDGQEISYALDNLIEKVISYKEKGKGISKGNYHFYINPDGLFKIDANHADWSEIKFTTPEMDKIEKKLDEIVVAHYKNGDYNYKEADDYKKYQRLADKLNYELYAKYHMEYWKQYTTREIAQYAYEEGYKGVWIKHVYDHGGQLNIELKKSANVYILFNPKEQAKSADPVTYDDDGEVITLSERFDLKNEDVRWSVATNEEYMEAVNSGDMEYAQRLVNKAAKEMPNVAVDSKGNPLHLYHGTNHFGFTTYEDNSHTVPFIYTSTKNIVSANYAGDQNYAFVRRIGRKYDGGSSLDSIIKDADTVWETKLKVASGAEKAEIFKKNMEEATRIADRLDELSTDLPYDWDTEEGQRVGNAIAIMEVLFWNLRDGDINSYASAKEDEEWQKELISDADRFAENAEIVHKYYSDNYDQFTKAQKQYLSYLTGYELGDAAIDIASMSKLFRSKNLLLGPNNNLIIPEQARKSLDEVHTIGTYDLYGDLGDNPYTIDTDGAQFWAIKNPDMGDKYYGTDDIAKWASEQGYTSVIMKNIYDYGDKADNYVFFSPNQIKSADPVTYDDNGNVIPLNERFDLTNKDIRFSKKFDIEGQISMDQFVDYLEKKYPEAEKKDIKPVAKATKGIIERIKRFQQNEIEKARTGNLSGSARTVALGITSEFVKEGYIDYSGLKISKDSKKAAGQIAAYSMILRNPNFETFRILFTKGNKILANSASSSYLVDSTLSGFKKYRDENYAAIKDQMRRLGADGYFIMHNHPSGDVQYSDADENTSKNYKAFVPGYRGQIVIDHNEYGYFDENNRFSRNKIQDGTAVDFHKKSIDSPLLYKQVSSPQAVAKLARTLVHNNDVSTIIYASKDGIRAIQEVDNSFLNSKDFNNYLKNRKVDFGSLMTFVVTNAKTYKGLENLYLKGVITDIVSVKRVSGNTELISSMRREKGPVANKDKAKLNRVYEEKLNQYGIKVVGDFAVRFSHETLSRTDLDEIKNALIAMEYSVEDAESWLRDINEMDSIIKSAPEKYDYKSTTDEVRNSDGSIPKKRKVSCLVTNSDYKNNGGSYDSSTICAKRRLYTGTFEEIQFRLPNTVLTEDDYLRIKALMEKHNLEVQCAFCYVEGSRLHIGEYTGEFIKQYKETNPMWMPTQADLTTASGLENVRVNHNEAYEAYLYFMNNNGRLDKEKYKPLFASQQKPKLYMMSTAYDGEIRKTYVTKDGKVDEEAVKAINDNGGIRLNAFSDQEIFHLIDTMQLILDMASVGFYGQGYTKQAVFAKSFGGTGLKINCSTVAKGVDKDGKIIFENTEGMNINEALKIRDGYYATDEEMRQTFRDDVGIETCVFNDQQMLAAWADDRIDFIIPFHRSQYKKKHYEKTGLAKKIDGPIKDYTYQQNEKWLEPEKHTHIYRGKVVPTKCENFMPNTYWDNSLSGKENAEKYLRMCFEAGKRPKFYKFLQKNSDGSYSLKSDGSTDGYWKNLSDYKMYASEDGKITSKQTPQKPVKPIFNMPAIRSSMKSYQGGHRYEDGSVKFEYSQVVVDEFMKEYVEDHPDVEVVERNEIRKSVQTDPRAYEPATLAEARAEVQRLQKENEKQQKRIEYLEGQMKTTKRGMDPKSIDRWVKQIVKNYGRDVDTENLEQSLKNAAEIFFANRNKELSPELEDKIKEALTPAADSIIRNAKVKDDSGEKDYKSLRATLKAGVFISDQDKSNIADFEDWRKHNIGYITISKNGSPIDTLYAELQDEFGRGFFPDGVDTPSDKLQLVVDVIRDMNDIFENPYESADMAEAMEYVQNELLTQMYNGVIRETEPTFADKMEARIQKECEKTAKLIDKAVAENQKQCDKLIEELKKEYKENIKSMLRAQKLQDRADRQRMSENEKLRRLIKRLRNKKLSAVNRARLEEIVGDLATRYIRLTGDRLEDLETLQEFMKENSDIIFPDRVQKEVDELEKKHIGDLNQEEVANLIEVLLNFETEVDNANKQIDAEDKRETFRQGEAIMGDVGKSAGTKAGTIREIDEAFVMNTLSPERFANRITGYQDNDPLQAAMRDLTKGEAKMIDHLMKASEIFDKWTEDNKLMRKWQGMFAEEIPVMGIGPNGSPVEVKITPAMRVSLYLHSLNDDNMRHIQYGGINIPDMKLYKAGKLADAVSEGGKHPVRFTRKDIQKIAAHMTDEEWAFANAVKEYFAGLSKDAINEVSVKLVGYDIAGEENYFPIYTNKNFTKTNFDEMKFDGTIEGMGFLKQRINSVAPIYLQDVTKVMKRSIEGTARYAGLAIPVRNMNKLLGVTTWESYDVGRYEGDIRIFAPNYSVLQAIDEKWGKAAIDYLKDLMQGLQTNSVDKNIIVSLYKKIRSNYAGAVLTLNAGVALKQAASYPTAMAVLGAKPLLRAMRFKELGKVDLELISKYTPVQWYRSRGFTTQEIGDIKARGINLPPWLNWIQLMDLLTTRKLWKASEFYVQEQMPQFKIGSDMYYEQVARIYNRVIWDTQPNYTMMQRPAYLRSNNPLVQTLMMFKTQPFQNFNIIYDAIGNMKAKKGDLDGAILSNDKEAIEKARKNYDEAKKNVRKALMSQVISLVVFAGMTALWALARNKTDKYKSEDGEQNLLTWAAGIGKDVLGGAAGMIPFGSDVWEALSSVIFNDRYYGYSSAAESAINDILSSISSSASAILNGKMTPAKWKKLAKDAAQTLGIPAKNIANLINAILSWFGVEDVF